MSELKIKTEASKQKPRGKAQSVPLKSSAVVSATSLRTSIQMPKADTAPLRAAKAATAPARSTSRPPRGGQLARRASWQTQAAPCSTAAARSPLPATVSDSQGEPGAPARFLSAPAAAPRGPRLLLAAPEHRSQSPQSGCLRAEDKNSEPAAQNMEVPRHSFLSGTPQVMARKAGEP